MKHATIPIGNGRLIIWLVFAVIVLILIMATILSLAGVA